MMMIDDGKTREILSYSENYFSVERNGGAFWHSLLIRGAGEGGPEVEFVHAVSAGGSVKFLPAV